jgi:hypothetical protein
MKMEDTILHLFCSIDDELHDVNKHPDALIHPSEVVTIGVIYALKAGLSLTKFIHSILGAQYSTH